MLRHQGTTGFASTVVDGKPLVVVYDGKPLTKEMQWARVEADDVLEQARSSQGIERLHQVRYAIIEPDASISVISRSG